MKNLIHRFLPAALVFALPFVFMPSTVDAQEEEQPILQEQEQEQCTAEFSPREVDFGKAAIQVTAQLSTTVGNVAEIEAPAESGIALASPEDLEAVAMVQEEGEQPQPIEMSLETNHATLWLSTAAATPGTYEVLLKGETGDCAAQITVLGEEPTEVPPSEEPPR